MTSRLFIFEGPARNGPFSLSRKEMLNLIVLFRNVIKGGVRMLVRKTVKEYRKQMKSFDDRREEKHYVRILKSTYWVLFIPIYSREEMTATNL